MSNNILCINILLFGQPQNKAKTKLLLNVLTDLKTFHTTSNEINKTM
jgi:hypothetical protein